MKQVCSLVKADKIVFNEFINKLNNISEFVSTTFGPNGKNVIMYDNGEIRTTKDGVSVINSITSDDIYERIAIDLFKRVTNRSVREVGDGTTSTAILLSSILNKINSISYRVKNTSEFIRGMDSEIENVIKFVKNNTRTLDMTDEKSLDIIKSICNISGNNDSLLSETITEAFKLAGTDGTVTVRDSSDEKTYVEAEKGFSFKVNSFNNYFHLDHSTNKSEFINPVVIVSEYLGETIDPLLPLLESVKRAGSTLIIIADNINQSLLELLLMNKRRGALNCVFIKPTGFGTIKKELLSDIAVMCNTVVHNESSSATNIKTIMNSNLLGTAKTISVVFDDVNIYRIDNLRFLNDRLESIVRQLDTATDKTLKSKLKDRHTKLVGKLISIKVGGKSDIQVSELKDRIDDCLGAVKSAITNGYTIGGGTIFLAYNYLFQGVKDEPKSVECLSCFELGRSIIIEAVSALFKKLAELSPFDLKEVQGENLRELSALFRNSDQMDKVKITRGIDMLNGEIVNLYEAGVIEPSMTQITSLESAYNLAKTIFNTGGFYIRDYKED